MSDHDDFAVEPVPGLPAHLPKGEHIVWQGAPQRASMACQALHVRKIGIYFAALAAWRIIAGLTDGSSATAIGFSVIGTLALGAVAIGVLYLIAHAIARTTIYTITNRRVVMRFGIALPMTFQFPFSQITDANMVSNGDGTGTIALSLKEHSKMSWPILWPHVRPWKLAKPQPSLRGLPDVETAAQWLTQGLQEAHNASATVTEDPAQNTGTGQPLNLSPAH